MKTFADGPGIEKIRNIFSLESFPLYGIARCRRTSAYCAVHLNACIDSVRAGLLPHLASLSQTFLRGLRKSVTDAGILKGVPLGEGCCRVSGAS